MPEGFQAAMPPAKAIDALADDYLAVREASGFSQRLTMSEALLVQKRLVRKLQPKLGKPVEPAVKSQKLAA